MGGAFCREQVESRDLHDTNMFTLLFCLFIYSKYEHSFSHLMPSLLIIGILSTFFFLHNFIHLKDYKELELCVDFGGPCGQKR